MTVGYARPISLKCVLLCLYALVRGGVLSRFALMARRAVPAFSTSHFSLAHVTHVWQRSFETTGVPSLLACLSRASLPNSSATLLRRRCVQAYLSQSEYCVWWHAVRRPFVTNLSAHVEKSCRLDPGASVVSSFCAGAHPRRVCELFRPWEMHRSKERVMSRAPLAWYMPALPVR